MTLARVVNRTDPGTPARDVLTLSVASIDRPGAGVSSCTTTLSAREAKARRVHVPLTSVQVEVTSPVRKSVIRAYSLAVVIPGVLICNSKPGWYVCVQRRPQPAAKSVLAPP